jgi:hypothetical protein
MYHWTCNGHYSHRKIQNGWTVALIGGALGMLAAGVWWWVRRGPASMPPDLRQSNLRHLGQAPARSHIQLFAHPARQEQPR